MNHTLLDIDKAAMIVFDLADKLVPQLPKYSYSNKHSDDIAQVQSLAVMDQLMTVFTSDLPFGEDTRKHVLEKFTNREHFNWWQSKDHHISPAFGAPKEQISNTLWDDASLLSPDTHQWMKEMGRDQFNKIIDRMAHCDMYGLKNDKNWSTMYVMEGKDVDAVRLMQWMIENYRMERTLTAEERKRTANDLLLNNDNHGVLKSLSSPEKEAIRRIVEATGSNGSDDKRQSDVVDFLISWQRQQSSSFETVVQMTLTGDLSKLQFFAQMAANRRVDPNLTREFLGAERWDQHDQYSKELYHTVFTHPQLLPKAAQEIARTATKCITDRVMEVLTQLNTSIGTKVAMDDTNDVVEVNGETVHSVIVTFGVIERSMFG